MEKLFEEMGERLRQVRLIFNEGTKLTANQFAHLLDESGDKIRNYELGRAAIPARLLLNLYRRGISPVYLLAGEGSIYAENEAGRKFQSIVEAKQSKMNELKILSNQLSDYDIDEQETIVLSVAAGKIERKAKK